MQRRLSIEWATALYALSYLPYVILTRLMATQPSAALGRPLTGLEILPGMVTTAGIATYVAMVAMGWSRGVTRVRFGGLALPFAGRWTFWSGVFTALILVTVPLSYTFAGVSLPFIQLLMRGDILILAPLADFVSGRRVRWWSWVALLLVAGAMLNSFQSHGGFHLPPLAWVAVALYTVGYFGRLFVMSKVAKNDDAMLMRKFFSEEKIVAFPVALVVLALITLLGGGQASELRFGFVEVWTSAQMLPIALCGVFVCVTGIFSAIILLDGRENSFCVPLERSASILAGVAGSVILALGFHGKMPPAADFVGAGLLILALVILSFAPRLRSADPS